MIDRCIYIRRRSKRKHTHTFLLSSHRHGAIDRELRSRGLVPPDGSVGKVDEKDAVLSQGTRARMFFCQRLLRWGQLRAIIIEKHETTPPLDRAPHLAQTSDSEGYRCKGRDARGRRAKGAKGAFGRPSFKHARVCTCAPLSKGKGKTTVFGVSDLSLFLLLFLYFEIHVLPQPTL